MKKNSRQLCARSRKLQDKRGSFKKRTGRLATQGKPLCTIASLQMADDNLPVSLVQDL
jgi:hypothetical protein